MAHDHDHHHSHGHGHHHGTPLRTVAIGFLLTAVILVVEVVVAILSHSLSLLADAGHVLTDLAALGLSWFALKQAERPPNAQQTYGYHRTGIMAALVNASTLILIAIWIMREAYDRFNAPVEVDGLMMGWAAVVGLVANIYIGWILSREGSDNLNLRSAMLHVIGDAMASVGVIVAALVLWLRPTWTFVDPAIGVLISLLIAAGAWRILQDATLVLMEGVPRNINVETLVERILSLPGVRGVHDVHVWCIASGFPLLTCHVHLDETDVVTSAAVMNEIKDTVRKEFGIDHCTLQPEWELCGPSDNMYCSMDTLRRAPQPHAHSSEGKV
ncbi:MAG: cation transporter [Armatimonadetes bacterium]|nr:cation transporter [Armatimonadota bacterium]